MNESQIASQLFTHAEQAARRVGFVLHPGAAGDLKAYCGKAAKNILKVRRADPKISEESLLKMAEIVVVYFIDEMIAESRRLPGYAAKNPGQLGEETFSGAKLRFCPCWPFC